MEVVIRMERATKATMNADGYLTVCEVAKRLKVSRSWLYKKAHAGVIPHVRIGSVIRFVENDVDAWINGHKIKGALKV